MCQIEVEKFESTFLHLEKKTSCTYRKEKRLEQREIQE
jgi:hypothetical protein